ncbi:hypothetical protein NliqN6_2353 [Naganishia liquefaciens]|uniref:Uncharacterized protein n=1 Tax=Naganishia liquefaciens TaxID=104408 RepID=A0A8H3TR79_9TREE|nr:hypothetical protein NliqN6_2353 [Naganishia liquefaciens]
MALTTPKCHPLNWRVDPDPNPWNAGSEAGGGANEEEQQLLDNPVRARIERTRGVDSDGNEVESEFTVFLWLDATDGDWHQVTQQGRLPQESIDSLVTRSNNYLGDGSTSLQLEGALSTWLGELAEPESEGTLEERGSSEYPPDSAGEGTR